MRERLIELIIDKLIIQAFDNGEYIETEVNVDEIADYLLENGVVVLPFKVGDMIDKFFSHNTIIALWYDDPVDKHHSHLLWCGMAWDIPEDYKSLRFAKFMGVVAERIDKSDTLNIKIMLAKEEAEAKLKEGETNGK